MEGQQGGTMERHRLSGGEVISAEGRFSGSGAVTLVPSRKREMSQAKKQARRWEWTPFRNGAREDDLELYHWQKAGVEVVEYAYAAFNKRLGKIEYTEEEYDKHLRDSAWTMADTDHLMDLCYQLDLRWPVIVDRYLPIPSRPLEQLQARYYVVAHKMLEVRKPPPGVDVASYGIDSRSANFDVSYEEKRRRQLHAAFCRTRAEEAEEKSLRDELKAVELESRKLKKSAKHHAEVRRASIAAAAAKLKEGGDAAAGDKAGHIAAVRFAAAAQQRAAAAASAQQQLTAAGGAQRVDKMSASRRPNPGHPFLQSARLRVPDAPNGGLSKGMLRKLSLVLDELGVPQRPTPTKVVCDAYDALRRDVVLLLSLQKIAHTRQTELVQLRKHLDETAHSLRHPNAAAAAAAGKSGHPVGAHHQAAKAQATQQGTSAVATAAAAHQNAAKPASHKRKVNSGAAVAASSDQLYPPAARSQKRARKQHPPQPQHPPPPQA